MNVVIISVDPLVALHPSTTYPDFGVKIGAEIVHVHWLYAVHDDVGALSVAASESKSVKLAV